MKSIYDYTHLICLDCGIASEKDIMELVCVYDGHGIEQDEFDYACPSCGSTNTTPAQQCECCGEWFDWTEMNDYSLCVGCDKKLQSTDKGETNG